MSPLLVKPAGTTGKVHNVTPKSAGCSATRRFRRGLRSRSPRGSRRSQVVPMNAAVTAPMAAW